MRAGLSQALWGLVTREASTRPAALMRVGLALLLWARFGAELLPMRDLHPTHLVPGLVLYAATTAMLLGLFSQLACLAAGAALFGLYYGVGTPYVSHHIYLLAMAAVLLGLSPCGRSYSLDRWLALRRGVDTGELGPVWAQSLICVQLSMIYFWGAFDKTSVVYLSGVRLEQVLLYLYLGSDTPSWWGLRPLLMVLSWGSVALEYWLSVALWVPRWRTAAILAGATFHGIIYLTMPVSTFSATMWLLYLAFLDPDDVHAFIEGISRRD